MIRDYYSLTKSGLVYGNLVPVIGGFALAAQGRIDLPLLLAAIVGIYFVMASGCIFNNYIDRDIDGRMERTKDRALVAGRVSPRAALVFGAVLGALGFSILAFFVNGLAAEAALFGFFFYVVVYSLLAKRRTVYSTLIGSISGATPPVVGYAAAGGRLDMGAVLLFFIMVLWQMPHFFAIAIRRSDEYAKAGIPIMPVGRGIRATKVQMAVFIVVFTLVAPLLAVFGYAGYTYATVSATLGIAWLIVCIKGFWIPEGGDGAFAANARWARTMFFSSLMVLVLLFATMAVAAALK